MYLQQQRKTIIIYMVRLRNICHLRVIQFNAMKFPVWGYSLSWPLVCFTSWIVNDPSALINEFCSSFVHAHTPASSRNLSQQSCHRFTFRTAAVRQYDRSIWKLSSSNWFDRWSQRNRCIVFFRFGMTKVNKHEQGQNTCKYTHL